ncbi:MAG: hypothetical protein C4530_01200 [Desulfobacteraceae bacterium]|nr:MAG: hypothetical protein C4530_01200 [Desulfobacteraceae bacterium]
MDKSNPATFSRLKWVLTGILFQLIVNVCPVPAGEATPSPSLDLEPVRINQGLFYQGGKVMVQARIPASCNSVVVRCIGPRQNIELMEKGRVMGLWMNVREIHLEQFPSIYLLWADPAECEIESPDIKREYLIGYDILKSMWVEQQPHSSNPDKFDDFLKLKEEDGLYRILPTSVGHIRDAQKGGREVEIALPLAAKAEPGRYTVTVIGLENGRAGSMLEGAFEISKSGLPALLYELANQHGLEYGIAAAILATLSGLAIGLVFSGKTGH